MFLIARADAKRSVPTASDALKGMTVSGGDPQASSNSSKRALTGSVPADVFEMTV